MTSKAKIWASAIVLVLLHALVVFAGFVAPADPTSQDRAFVCASVPPALRGFSRTLPIASLLCTRGFRNPRVSMSMKSPRPGISAPFVCKGACNIGLAAFFRPVLHLFGVEAPAQIFLAGTDNYGRDQFSRILYGGRISLAAGLLATGISLALGLLLGTISGFYGSWIDESLMRMVELFLVLPWLYLLLAVRAFLPLHISPVQTFFLLVAVIGSIGWARPARLVRGVVLSARAANTRTRCPSGRSSAGAPTSSSSPSRARSSTRRTSTRSPQDRDQGLDNLDTVVLRLASDHGWR